MFELNVLKDQVILDHTIVNRIRERVQNNGESAPSIGSNLSFAEHIEAQINFHLRGLDLEVKQLIKEQVIPNSLVDGHLSAFTQKDLAEAILSLNLPLERKIKNLQNWVTLSTDYTLNFEEVSKLVITAQYATPPSTTEAPLTSQTIQSTSPSLESNPSDKIIPEDTGVQSDALDFLNQAPLDFIPLDQAASNAWNAESDPVDAGYLSDENYFEDNGESNSQQLASNTTFTSIHKSFDLLIQRLSWMTQLLHRYQRIALIMLALGMTATFGGLLISKTIMVDHSSIHFSEACLLMRHATVQSNELMTAVSVVYDYKKSGKSNAFEFKDINLERLNGYLKRRNSILATEPYFSSIVRAAALNDINPILLFAIAGQEQGFVRLDDPDAYAIANNPFNVYNNWRTYNTNSEDAAHIAAGTILAISREKPENINSFKWLNQRYAEDPNWWKGVEFFYLDIVNYTER